MTREPDQSTSAGAEQPPAAELPSLRREIIGSLAIVFAGALFVAVAGIIVVVPRLAPLAGAAWVVVLLAADVAFFSWIGARILRRKVLMPIDSLIASLEAVAGGEYGAGTPPCETAELARLAASADAMAARLVAEQHALALNIRSLDDTNRLLTEARDAMIRAEKLASVGRLGAGIAHEVGNPLGAILGYLGLLGRGQEGQRLELVQAAEGEARRIDRIIRGLLDYARPREAVSQHVNVARVVADTLELLGTQGMLSHLHVECEADHGTGLLVQGDPYQLQQVLVNLLVNAADAIGDRPQGRVSVRAVRRPVREAPPHTPARRRDDPEGIDYSHRRRLTPTLRWATGDPDSPTGEVVELAVTDNGPGIPDDLVDQVFEPFVTTKEPGKGTGLGLALCARFVDGMGGTIQAGNEPGGGAGFRIVLPALPLAE